MLPVEAKSALDKDKGEGFKWEEVIEKFKAPVILILIGVILLGLGILVTKDFGTSDQIEIIEETTNWEKGSKIIIEVSGAVEKPGVYQFDEGQRIEDALIKAGGLSVDADRNFIEKQVNRASKLTDGQKIFLPRANEQSGVLSAKNVGGDQNGSSINSSYSSDLVNINTATLKQLDALPGIGPVYGQNIIEQRPYSNIENLIEKDVIPQKTYEKIKDKITTF